jgi:hypothetical protein
MKLTPDEYFNIVIGGQYKGYELSSMMTQDKVADSLWVLFYVLYSPSAEAVRYSNENLFNIYKSLPEHLIKYIKNAVKTKELDVSILRKIEALIKLYKD